MSVSNYLMVKNDYDLFCNSINGEPAYLGWIGPTGPTGATGASVTGPTGHTGSTGHTGTNSTVTQLNGLTGPIQTLSSGATGLSVLSSISSHIINVTTPQNITLTFSGSVINPVNVTCQYQIFKNNVQLMVPTFTATKTNDGLTGNISAITLPSAIRPTSRIDQLVKISDNSTFRLAYCVIFPNNALFQIQEYPNDYFSSSSGSLIVNGFTVNYFV